MIVWTDLTLPYINLITAGPAPPKKCINQCKLDKATQCCVGCGRTIKEITDYGRTHQTVSNKGF